MLKSLSLTLLIGPSVPVPAPKPVADALTSVQVNSGGERTGFQLTFAVSKTSPLSTAMLPAGFFDPNTTRVIIVVTLGGMPNVLVDGIVTRQEVAPSSDPGRSTLTVTGEDLSVLMDIVEMPEMRYPAMPEVARINSILARYSAFGIVPVVVPPVVLTVPIPTKKIPTQTGTDLSYIQRLARRHGYAFYLEPGPAPGMSIAYWGPDLRNPVPQAALSINMDANTNVESLTFSLDGLAKKILVATVLDPVTKKNTIPIPLPNANPFRPPLGVRLTPPRKVEFMGSMAKLEPDEAAAAILGELTRASNAISGSGSLDVLRYGRVLRARQLVGVRGAGIAYDGLYFVDSVTHTIKRGEYKQSFNLSRDGLISQTPVVAA